MNTPKKSTIITLLLLAGAFSLNAASGIWTNDASGNWSDTTQWLGGTVADGSGFTADFSTINITANRTVTLDAGHTLTTLNFGDTTPDFSWTLSGANTLTLAGTTPTINVVNQTATISSVIAGTVGLTKTGLGTLSLNGSAVNTYTGGTILNAGTLLEDFTTLGATPNLVDPGNVLTLGGGTLSVNGAASVTSAQTFASTTLNAGADVLTVASGVSGTANLTLGAITRNAGSTLTITLPASGNVTTTSGTASQILQGGTTVLPYAFIADNAGNLLDYAAKDATVNIGLGATLAAAQYVTSTGAGLYNIGSASGFILDVTTNGGCTGLTWSASTPSWAGFRFNQPPLTSPWLVQPANKNINLGAILITTNVGPNNITIGNVGSIDNNGARDFVIAQDNYFGELQWNGTGEFRGASRIEKIGRGTLVCGSGLNQGNTGNPGLYINGGVVAAAINGNLGAVATGAAVALNGGTLMGTANFTLDNAGANKRNINLLGNGGGIAAQSGTTLIVDGVVGGAVGTGALSIGIPASLANGNVAGVLPGTGTGTPNTEVDATGTVSLTGANTYTGGTVLYSGKALISGINNFGGANYGGLTFNGGTLLYAPSAAGAGSLDVSTGSGITVSTGGGVIDVNGNSVAYTGAIRSNGGGSLTVTSSVPNGTLTLSGASTYTGNTIISAGTTLTANNTIGSATGSGNVTVSSGAILSGTGIITGAVTWQSGGLAAVTQGSPLKVGVVTLNGNSVTVNVPGVTPLPVGNYTLLNYTASGSTGSFNTAPTYTGAGVAAGTTSIISTSGGVVTLAVASAGVSASWTNDVDGNWTDGTKWSSNPNVPHAKGDSATLGVGSALRTVTLNVNETVGGITMTNDNSFVIASAGNTLVLDNKGSVAAVNITAGTANAIQTAVALNDNAQVTVGSGKSLTISGSVANNTNGIKTLLFNGAGTNILTTANTYGPAAGSVGTTLNSGGILQVGNNASLGAGDVAVTGSATLQPGTAGLNLGNNVAVTLGATATINNGNGFTLGGVISGGGALTKNGNGTLALAGNNTYSGNTTLNAGALSISAAANVANTPNIILNGGDLLGSGTFAVNNSIGIGPTTGGTGATGLIDAASGQGFTISGNIASAGNSGVNSLIVNSGVGNNGTLILAGTNTFAGSTSLSNGVLQFASTQVLPNSTLNHNAGTVLFDGSITATTLGGLSATNALVGIALTNLSGAAVALTVGNNNETDVYAGSLTDIGSLTKVGTGALTIGSGSSGGASYSGVTTINSGTVTLGGVGNMQTTGNFQLTGLNAISALNVADTAVVGVNGGLYIASAGGSAFPASCTVTVKNSANLGVSTFIFGNVGGTRIPNNCAITVQDTASMTVSNSLNVNTGIGTTPSDDQINMNGGTLTVGNFITSGGGIHQAHLHFNGGLLKANADDPSGIFLPALSAVTAVVDAGGAKIDTTGFGLTIGANLVHGTGTPDGGLTKLGAGTLTLSGANTYTGNTTVSNGVLALSGSIAGSNIVVNGGATFDVSAVGGFTLATGQTLSNLTSTAVVNGNFNTASGNVSLNFASGTPSFMVTNGTLTLDPATIFNVNNTGAALNLGSFKLISTNLDGSGLVSGTVPATVTVSGNGLAPGKAASLQINNSELYLVVVTGVNTNPTNITTSVSGNILSLTWPGDHLGWTLQTNSVDLANTNYWFAYPGSASVTNVNITINPAITNVFFRLVYP